MPLSRALRVAAASGFVLTACAFAVGRLGLLDALVTLGASTIVPLGATLALDRDRNGQTPASARLATALVVASALANPPTMLAPRGSLLAIAGGVLHVVAAIVLAVSALPRIAWRGLAPLDELAIDAGLFFLPVGAAFALASRAGTTLLGFGEPVVSFTAAHFHYAGFAGPVVLGAVGRLGHAYGERTRGAYRLGTMAVVAGVPLTAAGIAGGAALERASAIALASGMCVASITSIATMTKLHGSSRLARAVVAISFLGLLVPMGLAVAFALTGSAARDRAFSSLVPLGAMLRFHGAVNAVVFALPALVALAYLDPEPRHRARGFAMSRLRGGCRIGHDFFGRVGALGATRTPTGILDSLGAYARPSFDAAAVAPEVRRFYEHTHEYDLDVTPRWSFGFRTGGRLWRAIARRIGQVELPTDATSDERVVSRIVDLDDAVDGRAGARGWIRTYADSGRALYVAAYAATRSSGTMLMNIAFPLPGSALVSVLRFDAIPRAGGLRVTTVAPEGERISDEGIYLATRFVTLRLPMTEWVDVWPSPSAGEILARHELFLFGRRYLVLEYRIRRRDTAREPAA